MVIVDWGHEAAIARLVEALMRGTVPPDEIVVLDQRVPPKLRTSLEPFQRVVVIETRRNLGFAAACNEGSRHATGELLVLVNPDTEPEADFIEKLVDRRLTVGRPCIVGAQLLLPDGRHNAGANPVHYLGLAWAGDLYGLRDRGVARSVFAISGGAFAVDRDLFAELGGFTESFFLYHEDVDLCWRARLAGHEVWYESDAVVVHDYEFEKTDKWYRLERNRLLTVLSNYEAPTLALLAPGLLAAEIGLLVVAARGGWLRQKLRSYRSVAGAVPWLRGHRRDVARLRCVPDSELLPMLASRIDSPLFPAAIRTIANGPLEAYGAVLRTLRPSRGRKP